MEIDASRGNTTADNLHVIETVSEMIKISLKRNFTPVEKEEKEKKLFEITFISSFAQIISFPQRYTPVLKKHFIFNSYFHLNK